MFKEAILENERRREIYNFIKENPGFHLRELQRRLKMPLASLEYHLGYMVRKNVIFGEKDGRFRRYYVKRLEEEDKKILSALRQKRLREIVLIILSRNAVKYQDFLRFLGIPSSTLSHYLRYLVDHDVLKRNKVGYENIYTIQDEDRVTKVLIAYQSSFIDKLIDKAIYTWMEIQFRKSKKGSESKTNST